MTDVQGVEVPLIAIDTTVSDEDLVPGVSKDEAGRDETERNAKLPAYERSQLYYDGAQYDQENEDLADRTGYTARGLRLPEHLRKHAYSSHIQEAIDVLADMFAEGISFDGQYAELLNQWWPTTGMEERADDWFRESIIKGDVYAVPDFDPINESMSVDFWEAESVWPVYQRDDWRKLARYYQYQTILDEEGQEKQQQIVWILLETPVPVVNDNIDALDTVDMEFPPDRFIQQLVEYVFEDDELIDVIPHQKGFFPLVHARGDTRHKLRSMFGDSMVTRKVQGTADRYNALGQLGFRVARQNSFSTIAVVGDSASLGAGSRDESIAKDIADVLRFPGGTDVKPIQLPSDPRMMEYQQKLLEKNLYKEFGLTKIDLEDFGGLGTISGYALEVLNRKERATYKRVRKNALAGIRDLANRMLDVHAIATGVMAGQNWWEIDPLEVYPERTGIEIVMGSGDIVDAVADRDDFTVGLVSREYVLRRKGLDTTEITKVVGEINTQKEAEAAMATDQQITVLEQQSQSALELAKVNAQNQVSTTTAATGSTSSRTPASSSTTQSTQTGTTQANS